jgi:hypothetical protein
MFGTVNTKTKEPVGEVTTRHLEGSIVETTYRGACTRALVQSVLDVTPEVMHAVPGAHWLLDVTAVTTTEAAARIPGSELIKIFRERGGNEFAVAMTSPGLRMLMSAVGFATGVPLKMFATRDEALVYLRSRPAAARVK